MYKLGDKVLDTFKCLRDANSKLVTLAIKRHKRVIEDMALLDKKKKM